MLKQHQVGVLFGLFVHAIGAARFVWTIAPLIVLLGLASIPFPRAKATIDSASLDAATHSSGFTKMLAVAQQAAVPFPYRAPAVDRSTRVAIAPIASSARSPAQRRESSIHAASFADAQAPVALRRIGDRWLQARAEHALLHDSDFTLGGIGERLLRSHDAVLGVQAMPGVDLTEAIIALRNDAIGGVLHPRSSGATARVFGRSPGEMARSAGATGEVHARVAVVAALPNRADVAAQSVDEATVRAERAVSPLKLSHEQRNVANFIARRYRVGADDVQRFVAHAYRAAKDFRLDPHLVLAVMSIESSFNPNARSSAGAQGLMQVLTRVHLEKFEPFGGARAAFDPMVNINVGSRILKDYLVREGTVEGALKSYVGAAFLSHDFGYGNKVLRERARLAAVAEGRPIPEAPTRRVLHAAPVRGPAAPAPTQAALEVSEPIASGSYAGDPGAKPLRDLRSL